MEKEKRAGRRLVSCGSLLLFATGVLILCGSLGGQAATLTWTGGGSSDEWSTSNASGVRNNWGGAAFTNNDNAIFGGTSKLTPTIGTTALTVGSITFNGGAGAFTMGGSATLTIVGGVTNNDDSAQTFSVSTITLGAGQTWNAGSVAGGSLTFNGTTLNLGASQTLAINGANNTSIANAITGTGTSGITKTGAGTLLLSGANSFSGVLVIGNGKLSISTINNASVSGVLGNSANAVVLGGSGTTGTLQFSGATASSTKKFTMANAGTGAFQIDSGGTSLTVGGVIDGSGGLTKSGAGTLELTANNTYTGATTVSGGKLAVGGTGSLSSTASVAVNAGGTLLLGGNERINNAAAVTLGGGKIETAGFSETVGALTLTANSIIDLGSGASTLTFAASNGLFATGKTLSIYNWTPTSDHLFFGSGSPSLDIGQLGQISFFSGSGTGFLGTGTFTGSQGEVTPVPEPSTLAVTLGLVGLIGWRERRRIAQASEAERRAMG